jgi:uncharacterized OB-fold protein
VTDTYGDPLSAPFWEAASEGRLVLQRCDSCGAHQHYPRPFCLACDAEALSWTDASGLGTVYSQATVHVPVHPQLPPPYVIAVVELDEGPRLTTNIVDGETSIGERVRVVWRDRADAPPYPVFTPA